MPEHMHLLVVRVGGTPWSLLERTIGGQSTLSEPTVLMRSLLTIELTDASFAFLFVPQVGSVRAILEGLGVGSTAATAG